MRHGSAPRRSGALGALLLALLVGAAPARANAPALDVRAGAVGAPVVLGPTPLVVTGERLVIDCREEAADGACSFAARYDVANPAAAAHEVVGAFYGIRTDDVAVHVDGRDVRTELSDALVAALDGAVAATLGRPPGAPLDEPPPPEPEDVRELLPGVAAIERTGFRFAVPPGGRVVLAATGRVALERGRPMRYVIPAWAARHPLLGTGQYERSGQLDYLVAPIRSWAGAGPIEVEIRFPSDWDHGALLAEDDPARGWRLVDLDDGVALQRTLTADAEDVLSVGFSQEDVFHHGGPIFGVGGSVGRERGLALRLGWEVAAPGWLLWSVAVDTDAQDWLTLTPLVEASSPLVFILPQASLGLGAPVRLVPETEVGVRIQVGLALGPLGFAASFDLFPGHDPDADEFFQATLLAQFTL